MLVDIMNLVGLHLPPPHTATRHIDEELSAQGRKAEVGCTFSSLQTCDPTVLLEEQYQRSLGGKWRRLAGPGDIYSARFIEAT